MCEFWRHVTHCRRGEEGTDRLSRSVWSRSISSPPTFTLWLGVAALLLVGEMLWPQGPAHAQELRDDGTGTAQKYWIFLDSRPPSSPSSDKTGEAPPVAPSYLDQLREVGVYPMTQSRWFHAVSARLSEKLRTHVAALPFVRSVRQVASLSPSRATASSMRAGRTEQKFGIQPTGTAQYGASRGVLSRINALSPLERGLDGHGVRVGFLDAHFAGLRHPAFSTLRTDDRLAGLRNFTEGRQAGTHGAGVVSVAAGYAPGSLVGPAHGATVLGAMTEFTEFERNVEEDHFVAGLEWLTRQRADVVNVSIGYTRFDDGQRSYSPDDLDGDTALTTRAVDQAAQRGVTVVVSAGNSGCADPDSCWYYVNTPADADSAIAVGAIAPDSSLAPFSARGPTTDGRRKPDVLVQGRDVPVAWQEQGYARLEGTSFASPQVTGIVAQMLQVNPELEPVQVRRLLRQTASGVHAPDSSRGWGIVNANAAVRAAEWRGRRTPPSTLKGAAPYRPVGSSSLVVPISAPPHTSTLRVFLVTPLGRQVHREVYGGHPGPNRLALDVQHLPPGLYRYAVTTDTGHRTTGHVSILQ